MANMTLSASDVLSLNNKSFCAYIVTSCILVIKMTVLSLLTAKKRAATKSYTSPEDVVFNKGGQTVPNDSVERVRRAHLNDLENIPIFWASAFAYLFTKPSTALSCVLFFLFVLARILHTVVYAVYVVRQPSRAICFLTGLLITVYLAIHSMIVGLAHLF